MQDKVCSRKGCFSNKQEAARTRFFCANYIGIKQMLIVVMTNPLRTNNKLLNITECITMSEVMIWYEFQKDGILHLIKKVRFV